MAQMTQNEEVFKQQQKNEINSTLMNVVRQVGNHKNAIGWAGSPRTPRIYIYLVM